MKKLKATFPKRCIGCELCVLEVQRQLKRIGLDESLIRILRKPKDSGNKETPTLEFLIEIDPRVNTLAIEKIYSICPTKVFEITEGDTDDFRS